ncbi:MAG: pyrroline-5-carboxylate reductase [Chloroflexi bacterium]|nr:pyrroline-5-carboxylate reductase [Chloroflexota bacterium]MCI0846422.1 pyrroline-5-carboxylate reductase [Chloroflexota bacterium]
MRLAFIGGGTMAEAILRGVLAAGLAKPDDISVGEPVPERGRFLSNEYGVGVYEDNLQVIPDADLVVFAVKPQDLPVAMGQLHHRLAKDQSALSIVAGAKMSTLTKGLGHASIIRVMPNTPAQIGCGMSLWTCSDEVDQTQRDLTQAMLGTVGVELYVAEEKYLDMATALSASGPGYIFLFIEALIDAGVHVGLPRDMARTLALQTVYGSTKLVMETGKHPAELKDMVVSPGGTTAAGLQVLERHAVPAAIVEAVNAAYQKSISLGQE